MKTVTEKEFRDFFSNKWYTVHPGFFKNSKRYIVDGHFVGYKDEETFKINYFIVEKYLSLY